MRTRNHSKGENCIARLKKTLRCRQGTTLVELVITFALIALFAVGSCQMISTAIKSYHQIRGLNNARQAADTLMDKITGEIEGAQVGVQNEEDIDDGITVRITDSGNKIDLFDRTGSHIYITSLEEKMIIHYYAVKTETETPSGATGSEIRYEAVNWTFADNMYMGFKISSLKFSQADQSLYLPNVIKVDLTLKGDSYGSFKTTRYVECYNFVDEQDFEKIKDEGGGGTEPPEEPDGPDVEEPDNPPDEDEDLDFEVGDVTFTADGDLQDMYEEANEEYKKNNPDAPDLSGLSVPKTGFYREGNDYYYVVAGAWYSGGQVGSFSVKINQDKVWDYSSLIDVSNPDNKHWTNKPEVGTVVMYNGEYYLVIGGGISPWEPPSSLNNWVKLNPKE